MLIRNRLGIEIFGTNTRIEGMDLGSFSRGDVLEIEFQFLCMLTRQEYTLTVATQHSDGSSQDWLDDVLQFTVVDDKDKAGVANLKTDMSWRVNPFWREGADFEMKLQVIQLAMKQESLDGWLFFDHHGRDLLALGFWGSIRLPLHAAMVLLRSDHR